ncbi:UNVERIFIED_CONTAM: hypothetical protein GTU68_041646 [Idotea baltica]|nr:hypothetical protein [Idotea baltica]
MRPSSVDQERQEDLRLRA